MGRCDGMNNFDYIKMLKISRNSNGASEWEQETKCERESSKLGARRNRQNTVNWTEMPIQTHS